MVELIVPEVAPEVVPVCVHAWMILPAHGPTSEGMCSKCDEVREFKNCIDWEDDMTRLWRVRKVGRPSNDEVAARAEAESPKSLLR